MNWNFFGKVHRFVYRISGGRLGAKLAGLDIALLEVTGRKSGKLRVVPLACYPYRDSVVVSASNNGMDSHPAWYLNLQSNPQLMVQLGSERFAAVAEDLAGQEVENQWAKVVKVNPHQSKYLASTKRQIPLVYLRRSQ